MTKIEKMDRATAAMLSAEIMEALAPLAAKYGVVMGRGNGTYSGVEFKMPIVVKVKGDGPISLADLHDIPVQYRALVGHTYKSHDGDYTFVGWKRKARTRPAILERGGKRYVFAESVMTRLHAPDPVEAGVA